MKADINVTPLIDVLLVILIIFMSWLRPRREPWAPPCPRLRTAGRSHAAGPGARGAEGDFALNRAPVSVSRTSTGGRAPPSRPAATGRSS